MFECIFIVALQSLGSTRMGKVVLGSQGNKEIHPNEVLHQRFGCFDLVLDLFVSFLNFWNLSSFILFEVFAWWKSVSTLIGQQLFFSLRLFYLKFFRLQETSLNEYFVHLVFSHISFVEELRCNTFMEALVIDNN